MPSEAKEALKVLAAEIVLRKPTPINSQFALD